MIVHVLLLEPKSETAPEEMQAILERGRALREKIPGLVDVQANQNKNVHNHGFTYGLVMRFLDDEHFKAYSPHPEHKAVSADLWRLCSRLLNFDYEEGV